MGDVYMVLHAIRWVELQKKKLHLFIDQMIASILEFNPDLLTGLPRTQQERRSLDFRGMREQLSHDQLLIELHQRESDSLQLQHYANQLLQRMTAVHPFLVKRALNLLDSFDTVGTVFPQIPDFRRAMLLGGADGSTVSLNEPPDTQHARHQARRQPWYAPVPRNHYYTLPAQKTGALKPTYYNVNNNRYPLVRSHRRRLPDVRFSDEFRNGGADSPLMTSSPSAPTLYAGGGRDRRGETPPPPQWRGSTVGGGGGRPQQQRLRQLRRRQPVVAQNNNGGEREEQYWRTERSERDEYWRKERGERERRERAAGGQQPMRMRSSLSSSNIRAHLGDYNSGDGMTV